MPYELTIKADFGAAHLLRHYKGKCERLHGHNWKLDIVLASATLNEDGMVMDFGDAKEIVSRVLEPFDHYYLNEVPPFDTLSPTSENIARLVADRIGQEVPGGVAVTRVTAWESDRCGATYVAGSE